MPKPTNRSVLRKLLKAIDAGDFKYEHKEKEKIDWSMYDQAQINEINDMLEYIRDVVDKAVLELRVEERYGEDRKRPGQPPVFPGNLAKAVLMQQYFQASNRVTQGLISLFKEKMRMNEFSYKSIERAYDNHYVQEILQYIFALTQEPVKDKETSFSTDGTGLPTSMKYNYEEEKNGKKSDEERKLDKFEQAILTVGTTYQVIADFIVTENPHANESPYLRDAISRVSEVYEVDVWCADAAYLSRENATAISSIGGTPRIYPKTNDTFRAKGSPTWKEMHYGFVENPQEWLRSYHQRSISETVNSTYVRMFPKPLLRKIDNRRLFEAFTRACDYNLKRLLYLKYLKGIEVQCDMT